MKNALTVHFCALSDGRASLAAVDVSVREARPSESAQKWTVRECATKISRQRTANRLSAS
jgi:hypothetical protein